MASFKYKKIERPGLPSSYCPVLPIKITGKGELIETVALLDSGADVSAMPRGLAEILELDLSGEKTLVRGIGGASEAVKTNVEVIIQVDHERMKINLPLFVILDANIKFPFILGREVFFSQFEITFRENEHKISLKKLSRS